MGFNQAPIRDIVVIKLDTDGTQQWVRMIDSGQDDAGDDMVELPNGDLIIVGQNGTSRRTLEHPRVIRLTADGTVVADQTSTDRFDRPRTVIADPDGGFAMLTRGGQITRYTPEGGIAWTGSARMSNAYTLTRLRDGSYLVGGGESYTVPKDVNRSLPTEGIPIQSPAATDTEGISDSLSSNNSSYPETRARMVKYSPEGRLVWERTYDDRIATANSVLEDPADGSLLIAGYFPDPLDRGGARSNWHSSAPTEMVRPSSW